MSKEKVMLSMLVCLALVSMACGLTINLPGAESVRGSGQVVAEERSISGVRRVNVANQGDLTIEIGDEEKLVVEAEENLQDYLIADVRGGELVLRTQNNTNIRPTQDIHYILTVKELEGLQVTSSGDIQAPELQADGFTIKVSSSGDIHIEALYADRVEVDITSSGSVIIDEGMLGYQDISISSSGSYDAREIDSLNARVKISSSGSARIWVRDELDVNISSSGNVYYRGDPQLNVRTTSSGEAIRSGD